MRISSDVIPWPFRHFDRVQPLTARTVRVNGRILVQCCATQYLAIPWTSTSSRAIAKVLSRAKPSQCGSFGSNFLGGTHESRLALETEVAKRTGYDAALAFASGWAANYALGEAVSRMCDVIASDKRSHNSVIHGLRAGKSKPLVADFRETGIETVISNLPSKRLALFSPSLEGITGEHVSPKWSRTARKRTLWIRDDCHSFGAIGFLGTEDFDGQRPDVRMLGLSKACGVMGAVVCGPAEFISALAQLASPWIFSTAVPPIMWEIDLAVLNVIPEMVAERERILRLAQIFRKELADNGIKTSGEFHITGVHLPADKAKRFEATLRRNGFYLKVSQYPTRPPNDPCARVCFTPKHTTGDAKNLSRCIVRTLKE